MSKRIIYRTRGNKKIRETYEIMPGTVLWYNPNAPRKKGVPKFYSSMELKEHIKRIKHKKR